MLALTASLTVTARLRLTAARADAIRVRRRAQQKHDLADQFFLRGQRCELLNFRDREHAPFDDTRPELERRNVLGDLGERLGQRNRIGRRVGNRIGARQILQQGSFGVPAPARSASVFFTTR